MTSPELPVPGPSTDAAPTESRTARLLSLEWRRVQLIVRLQGGPGVPLGASRLGIVSENGAWMPATRASTDGGVVCARFNVILGPDQMPLASGRWTLAASDDRTPRPLEIRLDDGGVRLEALRIPAGASEYVVTPTLEGRQLVLRVTLRPASDPGPAARSGWRRRVRGLGLLAIDGALIVLRALWLRRRPRVVLVSELSTTLHGNLGAIRDRLIERDPRGQVQVDVIARAGPTTRWRLRDIVRMTWTFARASAIVTDGHFEPVQRASWRVPTVQVWHGYGAFKQIGYSLPGRPGGIHPFSRTLKGYRAVTVGSDADVPIYAEAFGVPEERVHPTGIPRLDPFFDPSRRDVVVERARAAFPQAGGRRSILLAPTYRGSVREASYDPAQLDYGAIHRVCVERDAVFIIRMHPFVRRPLDIPPEFQDRIIDGRAADVDTNDLLFIVDLLITDYSSVIYEFSTLGRPMLFFAFDLEAYEAERGFYEPYESFVPGRIVRTCDELVEAIRADDYQAEKVRPFAERHVGGTDGRSTDRVIDLILNGRVPARAAGDPFCR